MTTAIIGAGEMGTWFARQDRKQGIEVILADSDIPKARDASREIGARFGEVGEAIRAADKVMLAASLGANEDIIDEYSTDLREKTVLDISSVKNGITGKLRMLGPKTYSIHPMWGGDTSDDLKGRNLISIPLHSLEDPAYARFLGKEEEIFRRQGANVRRVADEREHDILMAETLAAYHFGAMVMGATVSGNGLGFRERRRLRMSPSVAWCTKTPDCMPRSRCVIPISLRSWTGSSRKQKRLGPMCLRGTGKDLPHI